MDPLTIIVSVFVVIAIVVAIVGAIIIGCGDACSSSSSSHGHGHGSHDLPVCTNITNTWDDNELTNIRISLKGKRNHLLTTSSEKSTGSCWVGDSAHPLSLVDFEKECGYNWTFTDSGFLRYERTKDFEDNGLNGIDGHFYLTYSTSKTDTLQNMYDFDGVKGKAYAATMTILPIDECVGCNVPLCVQRDEKTGHIYAIIDDEIFYLTANSENNHVFWYSNAKDYCYAKLQHWEVCVKVCKEDKCEKETQKVLHIGRTKSEALLSEYRQDCAKQQKYKSAYCV